MGRLVIASNRTATPGESRAGGLAVALWDALVERGGGVWFGWSGEIAETTSGGIRTQSQDTVEFALADLTQEEFEGYYLGHANRALWPVCHYRLDLAEFVDQAFEIYAQVNRRFGQILARRLRQDDQVWVHDYHLLLMGHELRNAGWRGRIGFFLHIPFPASEIFTALPSHKHIARGLADYDLIGFQTERDTANFRGYMIEHHGAQDIGNCQLRVFERTIEVRAFPIGIDPEEIARFAVGDSARKDSARLSGILGDCPLVLGVDRMDYSKGLLQRMQAFERVIDGARGVEDRVTFVQIAPPSRELVHAYMDLREELDRLAGRINSDNSDLDWTPIRYLARGYRRETLTGIYRLAQVGFVTPLYDGMNLVAKEFVAAQDPEDPGVLVLSEFAGAAEQMEAALIVNPHDINAMADAVRRGLAMPLEERRERWTELSKSVQDNDIGWWLRSYLDSLDRIEKGPQNPKKRPNAC